MRAIIIVENGEDDLIGYVVDVTLSNLVPVGGLAAAVLGARVDLLVWGLDPHEWAHRCHVACVASKLCRVDVDGELAERLRHRVLYHGLASRELASRNLTLGHLCLSEYNYN